MPFEVLSLYEMCLEWTALLLKQSYWTLLDENPFSRIAPSIIDTLILYVSRASVSCPLQSSDLYQLLLTGRVNQFTLENINVDLESFENICTYLSASCRNLVKIKLKNVDCNMSYRTRHAQQRKAESLSRLLSMSENLKSIESCFEFSLQALKKCVFLEKIVLNFVVKGHLHDFLEVDNRTRPHSSLKCLEVYEDTRHPISYFDVGFILEYCTELIYTSCDISQSLAYLHSESLYNGTLTAKYKLQRCCLGRGNRAVSRDELYITLLTCPNLKDLSVVVKDVRIIYTLKDFDKLTSLLLTWKGPELDERYFFDLGVQILLGKPEFGHSLVHLRLYNFTKIDFAAIGNCCPNLETLVVEYAWENNQQEFLPTSFQKLQILLLKDTEFFDCGVSTLVGILSNAKNLEVLRIIAGNLTDDVISRILQKNSLSKLKAIWLTNCVLSFHGLRNLISSLTALECFKLSTLPEINFNQVAAVVHEVNPQVNVECTNEIDAEYFEFWW